MENSELNNSKTVEETKKQNESLNESDLNTSQENFVETDNDEFKNIDTSQNENQNITSPPPPSLATSDDFNDSNAENTNTESIVNIESYKVVNEPSSITESTVVITKSQLGLESDKLDSDSEKFVEVENNNHNVNDDSRNESKDDEVVDSDTSLTDKNDESSVSIDPKQIMDDIQDNIEIAQVLEGKETPPPQPNSDTEVENLEKDYEILKSQTYSMESDIANKLTSSKY